MELPSPFGGVSRKCLYLILNVLKSAFQTPVGSAAYHQYPFLGERFLYFSQTRIITATILIIATVLCALFSEWWNCQYTKSGSSQMLCILVWIFHPMCSLWSLWVLDLWPARSPHREKQAAVDCLYIASVPSHFDLQPKFLHFDSLLLDPLGCTNSKHTSASPLTSFIPIEHGTFFVSHRVTPMKAPLPSQLNIALMLKSPVHFGLHSDTWGPNIISTISLIIFSSKLLNILFYTWCYRLTSFRKFLP